MTPTPNDPRNPVGTIEQQITAAIAAGFQTVLGTKQAQDQEMVSAAKELRDAALMMTRVARDDFVAGGGLRAERGAPSAKSVPQTTRHATKVATTFSETAEQYLREDLGAKIAVTEGIRDLDYGGAMASGGIEGLRGATRAGLRNSVFNAIASRVQSALPENPNDLSMVDSHGRLHDPAGRFLHSASGYLRSKDGSLRLLGKGISMDSRGRYRDAHGRFVSASTASTAVDESEFMDTVTAYNRGMAMKSVAMRGLEAWKDGQPVGRALMAGLPQGVLRAGGAAVAGLTAAKGAWEWGQGQYAANHDLQQYYGGSNMDQWGDRFNRWTNSLRGFFSFQGSDQYDQYWNNAMELGLRGGSRDKYIDASADIYGQGADGGQVKAILETAVTAGHQLGGLAGVIRDVGNAAREAGVSAKNARDIFIANYKASSETMFSEETQGFSGDMAQAQSQLPRRFQDMSLTNLYTNTTMDFLYASQAGMGITQFRTEANENPSVRVTQSEEWVKRQLSMIRSQTTGKSLPVTVNDFVGQLGVPYNSEYHSELLGAWIERQGFLRETLGLIVRTTQNFDSEMSDADAVIWAGELFIEGQSVGSQMAQAEAAAEERRTAAPATRESSAQSLYDWAGSTWDPLETAYLTGMSPNHRALATTIDPSNPGSDPWNPTWEDGTQRPYELPSTSDLEGQMNYPLVQEMISRQSELGISSETKVAVYTADGWKEVSMAEAVIFFPDQLQSGIARIRSGAAERTINRTIPEILGYGSTDLQSVNPTSINSAWARFEGGTSISAPAGSTSPTSILDATGASLPSSPSILSAGGNERPTQTVVLTLDPQVRDFLKVVFMGDDPSSTGPIAPRRGTMGLRRV